MGKIKDERKRNKSKKLITQIVLGLGLTCTVALTVVACTHDFGDSEAGGNPDSEIVYEESQFQDTETQASEIVEEPDTMQIVMVGDMLMHDRIIETGLKEDGTYNYDHLFENVKDTFLNADLAIADQETIMGGPEFGYSGYPRFNSPYELADAEVKAGFDVLLFATNHVMDKGEKAIFNCMNYLDENYPDLGYVGINRSQQEQDEEIYVYEANGIKVAILNYTLHTNGISLPSDKPYLVNLLNEQKIRSHIRKAEEIADFTIICPHWGTEYNLGTDRDQAYWVNVFLDEGADLVLGAHPHVIEPIEWVSDDEGNKMLVYYSLGNYMNGTDSTGHGVTNRMVGGIADVTIGRNEETGEVEVIEYGAIPIVCHVAEGTDFTVYYMEDYTEEMAKENLILLQDEEFSVELCESIFDQVWGEQ